MCLGMKAPKVVKPPAPALPPIQPNKQAVVDKGPKSTVNKAGKKQRRGTARKRLVISSPAGVNPSSSGVGTYS